MHKYHKKSGEYHGQGQEESNQEESNQEEIRD